MKRIVTTARATTASAFSKTLKHSGFARSLRVPSCYPKSNDAIHLH